MKDNFETAFTWLLIDESGPESKNDPSRGEVSFGVTAKKQALWLDKIEPFAAYSRDDAKTLLKMHVWDKVYSDELSRGLDYWMFDCGYRFSPQDAVRWLSLSLDLKPQAESRLVLEIVRTKSARDVILNMEVLVRRRMRVDPLWEECKHWWTNRTTRARDRAIKFSRNGDKTNGKG